MINKIIKYFNCIEKEKNMLLIIILSIIILIIIIYLLGPRVKISTHVKPITLPANLDEYLSESENRVKNLIPGTEKKILWAKNKNEKTEYSIIYFHGFTTSRQEISPVTETIAKKINANIFFTRLSGHGIDDVDALGKPGVNDWVNDAWEAYLIAKQIGNKVILVSMSAGGPLSLWLCLHQKDIVANIMLSPMFEPAASEAKLLLLPWGNALVKLILGKYREVEPTGEKHARLATCKYPSETLLTMMGLCKLSWQLNLESLKVPTLCIYTDNDDVVSVPRMKKELNKVKDKFKKIVRVDAKHHCVAGDIISPEMNETVIGEIMTFLEENISLKN